MVRGNRGKLGIRGNVESTTYGSDRALQGPIPPSPPFSFTALFAPATAPPSVRRKHCPRPRLHIPQQRLLPCKLGMPLQKLCRQKVRTAWMARPRHKAHLRGHGAVRRLSLHRAARIVRIPCPLFHAAGRVIDMAAKGALVGLIDSLVQSCSFRILST